MNWPRLSKHWRTKMGKWSERSIKIRPHSFFHSFVLKLIVAYYEGKKLTLLFLYTFHLHQWWWWWGGHITAHPMTFTFSVQTFLRYCRCRRRFRRCLIELFKKKTLWQSDDWEEATYEQICWHPYAKFDIECDISLNICTQSWDGWINIEDIAYVNAGRQCMSSHIIFRIILYA